MKYLLTRSLYSKTQHAGSVHTPAVTCCSRHKVSYICIKGDLDSGPDIASNNRIQSLCYLWLATMSDTSQYLLNRDSKESAR